MWHIHQKDVAFLMNYFHISHDVLLDSLTGRTLNTGPTLTFGDKGGMGRLMITIKMLQ